jgi:hypothetical protein
MSAQDSFVRFRRYARARVRPKRYIVTFGAVILAALSAVGCGVQAKKSASEKHGVGVCDSVKPLFKTKNRMDALDRKIQKANSAVTSLDALRKLSQTYRNAAATYADLETNAKAEIEKVDARENTETIQRMWRQLVASLHQRKVGFTYYADQFAHPERLRTHAAEFSAKRRAFLQRGKAQDARMESVLSDGLSSLGFERRSDGFFIDC